MSLTLPPPPARTDLPRAVRTRRETPSLADYPQLLSIATAPQGFTPESLGELKNELSLLDVGIAALKRIELGANSSRVLMQLCNGPQTAGDLASLMTVSPSIVSPLLSKLESLGLIRVNRQHPDDRRLVTAQITQAGRNVIGSIATIIRLELIRQHMNRKKATPTTRDS